MADKKTEQKYKVSEGVKKDGYFGTINKIDVVIAKGQETIEVSDDEVYRQLVLARVIEIPQNEIDERFHKVMGYEIPKK